MKAVILAAGYGARLKPLTDAKHKTMVSVSGERIIDRIMGSLLLAEITEVVVVLGHMADELQDYLSRAYSERIEFAFVQNSRYRNTNNIYSLSLALEHMDDDVLLIECDLFFEPEIVRDLVLLTSANVAVVAKYQTGMDGTVLSVDGEGLVNELHPTYTQGPAFNFSDKYKTLNIYKFSASFVRDKLRKMVQFHTQVHGDNCYYEVVLGLIIYLRAEDIKAFDVSGRVWMEIDTMNDLDKAEYLFAPERRYDMLSGTYGGYWNYELLDFCFIRNMYFPRPSLLSDIRYNLDKLLFNYGSSQAILNRKLAEFLLLPERFCCLLNGASQGIKALPSLLETDRIATFSPTFEEYLRVFKDAVRVDPRAHSLTDLSDVAAKEDVRCVLLANPNNPTGQHYSLKDVSTFVETASRRGQTVVLDESFIDFAGGGEESMAEYLIEHKKTNVILLKSLSKSLGVPGVRLGYCLSANEEWMRRLNAMVPIWNANSIAQYVLELLPKYRNELSASFARTRQDRDSLMGHLRSLEFLETFPSGGNYVLCRLQDGRLSADELARSLLRDDGIFIKDCTRKFQSGTGEYVRFAVRTPEDNQKLIRALSRAYERPLS